MSYIGNTAQNQTFVAAIDYFSGNGSTTAFTLSKPVASVAQVQVVVNNVAQNPSSAYTVSGSTITFTGAPTTGTNNIYVYYTSPITQTIAPSAGTVQSSSIASGGPTWDANGNVSIFNGANINAGNTFGMKNRLINGAMVIDQRNAGASVATSSGTSVFGIDRWAAIYSQTSKFTMQQNAGSVTPPAGFKYYLGVTSSSAYTVGSSEQFNIYQAIEGFNAADLGWGAAGATTVTLSFWVRSSLTGTFGGCLNNDGKSRAYPFTYTISAANTWEQKTVTIAGDTSGTWNTTTSVGIYVVFGLGVGSTVSATAGSWTGAGSIFGATGATSVVGTSGATFYITGVQLEKGSIATPFDFRSITQELQLCYRYCYRLNYGSARVGMGTWNSATSADIQYFLPVEMRYVPSLTATASGAILNYAVAWFTVTSVPVIVEASTRFIGITLTASAGAGTQGKGATWGNGSIGDPNAYVSAEL